MTHVEGTKELSSYKKLDDKLVESSQILSSVRNRNRKKSNIVNDSHSYSLEQSSNQYHHHCLDDRALLVDQTTTTQAISGDGGGKYLNGNNSATATYNTTTARATRSNLLIFIKYMIKLLKKMSFLFDILSPSKKNRLPPITDDLLLTPATKLSARIKQGQLTSHELVSKFIERIKQVQPLINAVAEDNFDEALKEACTIDDRLKAVRDLREQNPNAAIENERDRLLWNSPLAGVPISIKESIAMKGKRSTAGLAYRKDWQAPKDSVAVENMRNLGLIPLVTTNVPELTMYWADCRNLLYGRTNNPYDLARVPGASSGGEGSLLGSGGSLVGIGSDIGGSLRLPAQFCGIFSHKPTPYAINVNGNFPSIKPRRMKLFTFGPMTRYASDLKPLLRCMIHDHQPLNDTSCSIANELLEDDEKRDQLIEKNFQENDALLIKASESNIDDYDKLNIKLLPIDLDTPVDLKEITIYYCDFGESKLKPGIKPQRDIVEGMRELVGHFSSQHNCSVKPIDLDKYYRYAMMQWHIMMRTSPTANPYDEIKEELSMKNLPLEWIKLLFGTSAHTKESMFAVWLSKAVPHGPVKGPEFCEKFLKMNAELRKEFNEMLGNKSVLIVPTLPAVAYKHNEALTKTDDWVTVVLFNIMCCPTTHANFGLDKDHKMPFGFSIAAKPGLDRLTLAVAEEIEAKFGGWRPPSCQLSGR